MCIRDRGTGNDTSGVPIAIQYHRLFGQDAAIIQMARATQADLLTHGKDRLDWRVGEPLFYQGAQGLYDSGHARLVVAAQHLSLIHILTPIQWLTRACLLE